MSIYALIDPELRTQLNLREPSKAQTLAAKVAVRSFIRGVRLLPDPKERSLVERFGKGMKV